MRNLAIPDEDEPQDHDQTYSQIRATQLSINVDYDHYRNDSFHSMVSLNHTVSPSRIHLSPQLTFPINLNPVQEERDAPPEQPISSHSEQEEEDEPPPIRREQSSFQFIMRHRVRRVRAIRIPAYGKILYTRNHLSICRGVFFGVVTLAPFTVINFLLDFPLFLKAMMVLLQVFGILDLLVFFAYEDKLNDMFLSGDLQKNPRGCTDHATVGFILSIIHLCLVGVIGYIMHSEDFLKTHFIVALLFVLQSLLYFMSLCTIKAVVAYLVMSSTLTWLVLAIILGLFALIVMVFSGCKVILGKKIKLPHEKEKLLSFSKIKEIRLNQGDDFSCSVCLEGLRPGDRVMELPCNVKAHHFFHFSCGKQWLENNHTCPMCRKDYPSSQEKKTVWEKIWLYRDLEV